VAVCRAVVNKSLYWATYGPPSTGRIQQLAYNANHKQGAIFIVIIIIMHSMGNHNMGRSAMKSWGNSQCLEGSHPVTIEHNFFAFIKFVG